MSPAFETFFVVRSCLHLGLSLGPVLAAVVVATRFGGGRGPASAAWLLAAALFGGLLGDAVQMLVRQLAGRTVMSWSSLEATMLGIDCGCQLPLMLLAGIAFLMMRPVAPPTAPEAA